jgi:hypothetical protein
MRTDTEVFKPSSNFRERCPRRLGSLARNRTQGCLVIGPISRLASQLQASLFILFGFFGEISLALFELVVWFGQEASSSCQNGKKTGLREKRRTKRTATNITDTPAAAPHCKKAPEKQKAPAFDRG